MDRCVGAVAMLPEGDRKDLAVQALACSATISDLANRHGVSRKFIYQQADKARTALDDAFLSAALENEVLFQLTVTKTWLRQVIVGLMLICRSSYRGVVEFLRDLLGVSISVGTVHHVLRLATRQAGVVNHDQDLSGIRVGLHDEIFQGEMPVLAGVDAASTYCYLLASPLIGCKGIISENSPSRVLIAMSSIESRITGAETTRQAEDQHSSFGRLETLHVLS
jgi:hypothetical protein